MALFLKRKKKKEKKKRESIDRIPREISPARFLIEKGATIGWFLARGSLIEVLADDDESHPLMS
jgi:hypothetical protein